MDEGFGKRSCDVVGRGLVTASAPVLRCRG
jgi:hypothetical protein